MTARQALRDYIDGLSDEESEAVWEWITSGGTVEFEPLTYEQRASIDRGRAQSQRGETIRHADVARRFESKYSSGD